MLYTLGCDVWNSKFAYLECNWFYYVQSLALAGNVLEKKKNCGK
jgi:hypothetical protein